MGVRNNLNITASAGLGGSISEPGTASVSRGSDKTYTFTPDEGYLISSVSIDGVALTGTELTAAITNASYTFTDVQEDATIHVDFTPKTYDVTHTTTNITFPAEKDGPDKATHGQEFSSILSAETSYTLPADITVKIGDQILDPSAYTYDSSAGEVIIPGAQVTGNIEIIATAVPQSIDLTIVASAGAGGSISRPGTSIVTMGTDESYAFTPDTGYRINAVIIDGVPLLGAALDTAIANGSYTFTNLQDDATIHVDFALKTYDVTHTTTNITFPAEKDGPDKATHGQEFTTALTPELGYKLPNSIEVKVDGVTLDPSSYSYDPVTGVVAIPGAQVTGEIEIIAVAKHTTFDLDADAGEGGSISDLGTTVVNFGSDKTYTFTPDEGYEICSIIINGVPLSGAELEEAIASGSYTFDDVQSDASIRVLFKLREVDESSKSTTPTDTGSTDSTKTVSTPKKTGDSAQTGLLVALLVSGLAGLLFLMRQRSGK